MVKRVLVAFGSRYGCTAEISHEITKLLNEKEGLQADLLDLRRVEEKKWLSIDDYDGIVVGTGIRIGRWTKETKNFLQKCKESNKLDKKTLGLFVSCGYAADEKFYPVAKEKFLEERIRKIGIKPAIYEAFGGVFDFSESSILGLLDKKILKYGSRDLNLVIDHKRKNDYRNWEQIQGFISKFVELLGSS
ncbi:MAG: flavodoxin domain-containing protein [Candidatus Hodarchaeales archaeon]